MLCAPAAATRAERLAFGKARRRDIPRAAHGRWEPADGRADPVAAVRAAAQGRVAALLPLRHERMAVSPFAFYRGAAGVMAGDLAATPITGITTQLCGDAHCANFGGFATPDGIDTFEVNDFDETLRGPWEWDVKRLAASLILAARSAHLRDDAGTGAAANAIAAYRGRMYDYAVMTALEVWADRIDAGPIIAMTEQVDARRAAARRRGLALPDSIQHRYLRLTTVVDGKRRIVDAPPLVEHLPAGREADAFPAVGPLLERYRAGLREDAAALLTRYRFTDWAVKVVGVGSVGTRCIAALLLADDDDPLILQIKEAGPSVLEPYLGRSPNAHHGQRVVAGQRLIQSACDQLLGWADDGPHHYYVRQLRVLRAAPELGSLRSAELAAYAHVCGQALAAAHARNGQPAEIAGYLGRGDRFDAALVRFAVAYAANVERDFELFSAAHKRGDL